MAEYYSAELSQKVKRGIAISASKCKFFGGGIPLGYKVDEEKRFIINEETAPIVKQMFEMLANGYNYAEIARYMNERGIPPRAAASGTRTVFTAYLQTAAIWVSTFFKATRLTAVCRALSTMRFSRKCKEC